MNFDLIKQKISLHQVCASYGLELKKSGGNLTACCPFHTESTPSFHVYPDNHFHCFGCGKHGTILDFVALAEHCDLYEAGRKLCEKFNPNLLDADDAEIEKAIKYRKERESITALEEKKTLVTAVYNLCNKLHDNGNDMAAQSFESALANDIYGCDELYSCLIHNGESATANQILNAYHPEFKEEPKRGRGRPAKEKLCLNSLEEWLTEHNITIRYNVMSKSPVTTGLDDMRVSSDMAEEFTSIYLHDCLKFDFSCTRDNVQDLLGLIAARHEFNPILDLLAASPKWDGVDRLEIVYNALHLHENDTLSRMLVRKWFIQSISLLYNNRSEPFGAEGVLVLNGPQRTGKTSFLRKMFLHDLRDGYLKDIFSYGVNLFKEGAILGNDRDSIAQNTTAWCVELGELAATLKNSNEDFLKNFVTRFSDEYRVPYGRSYTSYSRRTSFAGTVNDPEFLGDPTGSRRWWVIPITQRIDLDALDALDKIQFWKQIETYSNEDRQSFRLSDEETEDLNGRNTVFEKSPPAVEEIRDIIASADAEPNAYKWIPTTISRFQEYYPVLSRYNAATLGKAIKFVQDRDKRVINSTYIPKDKMEEYGLEKTKGRFITLPYPRTAHIYTSPSEIPPEDRATFADSALKIAQEGLSQ